MSDHTPTPHAPEIGRTIRLLPSGETLRVEEATEIDQFPGAPQVTYRKRTKGGSKATWGQYSVGGFRGAGWDLQWEYVDTPSPPRMTGKTFTLADHFQEKDVRAVFEEDSVTIQDWRKTPLHGVKLIEMSRHEAARLHQQLDNWLRETS